MAKLKAEGAAYFASLEAKLAGLATVPVNPKVGPPRRAAGRRCAGQGPRHGRAPEADAAQKNAAPYMKAALDTQGMVLTSPAGRR